MIFGVSVLSGSAPVGSERCMTAFLFRALCFCRMHGKAFEEKILYERLAFLGQIRSVFRPYSLDRNLFFSFDEAVRDDIGIKFNTVDNERAYTACIGRHPADLKLYRSVSAYSRYREAFPCRWYAGVNNNAFVVGSESENVLRCSEIHP